MPRLPGFIGPSYKSQSIVAADDQTFNWIPAKIESGNGAAPWVFDPAPGYSIYGQWLLTSGTRASYQLNGEAFIVMGAQLIKVLTVVGGLQSTPLNIIAGTGWASISSNGEAGNQIMVASDTGVLYWYNVVTTAFGTIADVGGTKVAFLNGYFIALDPDTSTIHVSALNDGTSWDPLDAAQRNDYPDKWKAMAVRLPDLLLFGSETISVFYNDPNSDFPFVPNPSIAIARGIKAPESLAMLQNNPIWLADDLTVRYMNGYTPVRVSNHALEYAISQYSVTEDADAFTYNEQGHALYVLSFPTANESWSFDLVTGQWIRLGPYDEDEDTFGVLPVVCAVKVQDLQLVGHRTSGYVYKMSQTFATEIDGTTGITRRRRAPVLMNELLRINHHNFWLFMEVGTANAAPPGDNPTMLLQWSNDGGHTFNTGQSVSIGTHNAWNTLVRWWMLGQARQRVYQLTCSAPIPLRLVDAYINHSLGAS